jgi:plasmid stabilization system protein ParE
LAYIAEQDPASSQLVRDRVEQALKQIAAFPAIGTPGLRRGIRRFAVPNTGHVINYRVTRSAVRIQSWYRARRRSAAG